MPLTIQCLKSEQDFLTIAPEWEDLEDRVGHSLPTCSYQWLSHWWKAFRDREDQVFGFRKELCILVIRQAGELHSILPLVKLRRKFGFLTFEFLEFMGQQWGGAYSDIIGHPLGPSELAFTIQHIRKEISHDILYLKHLPWNSKTFTILDGCLYATCPDIEMNQFKSFQDFIKTNYSKKLKQNLRTGSNRATKEGLPLTRSSELPTESLWRDVIRISATKLRNQKTFVYGESDKAHFYKKVMDSFESDITAIRLGGKLASYRINVYYRGTAFCLDAAYDRDFSALELGAHSVDASLEECFNRRMSYHCMGPGLDSYKLKFTNHHTPLKVVFLPGTRRVTRPLLWISRYEAARRERAFLKEVTQLGLVTPSVDSLPPSPF